MSDSEYAGPSGSADRVCMHCAHWDHDGEWQKEIMKHCLHVSAGRKRSCIITGPMATCEHWMQNAQAHQTLERSEGGMVPPVVGTSGGKDGDA
jgi:hypothetical protein